MYNKCKENTFLIYSMNSDKKNAGEYYISLLFEKCIYRDWKLPKYNISELNYDCYGSPELTAVCLLLSKTTQGMQYSQNYI